MCTLYRVSQIHYILKLYVLCIFRSIYSVYCTNQKHSVAHTHTHTHTHTYIYIYIYIYIKSTRHRMPENLCDHKYFFEASKNAEEQPVLGCTNLRYRYEYRPTAHTQCTTAD